jgi:hypothetical protein
MSRYSDPDEWTPFPGAPRFWRRVWDPGLAGTEITRLFGRKAAVVTPPTPDGGLVIYGFSAMSDYAEDRAYERAAWRDRRMFPAICFSVACVSGEYGFVPADEVKEISREEFLLAQSREWE